MVFWIVVILIYYVLATLLPIDKIIGKLYPIFGVVLILMALGIIFGIIKGGYSLPEIRLSNLHPDGLPVWPYMFVTVACGAISGFHATQSPLVAKCITTEKDGRKIFYGAMIAESVIALVWAAGGIAFYGTTDGLSGAVAKLGQSGVVYQISTGMLGKVGGLLAIIGVVACPITSGDTAFRSARLIIADFIHLEQHSIRNRLMVCIPMFAAAVALLMWQMTDKEGFNTIAVKPMSFSKSVGTWYVTLEGDFKNMYYTYKITIGDNTYEVVDPYAKTVGVNGDRGMIVDLDDTDPEGWSDDSFKRVSEASDAIVWEVSVRDFSAAESSGVSEKNRGKFLAFTEKDTTLDGEEGSVSTCVSYLKELGVNYVQINPFYDFASIDEADSLDMQYNWGYDPKNYNAPEGSYSSDPYDGRTRITECKQMIKALHEAGIGVGRIMVERLRLRQRRRYRALYGA